MPERPTNTDPKASSRAWVPPSIASLVLLIGGFAYVWLRLKPAVEYHAYGPFFYLGHSFFEPYWRRPGGLAEYAAVALAQLSCYNWSGALAFACVLCLVYLAAHAVLRHSGRSPLVTPLVPVFLLLLLRNRFGSSNLPLSITLLLSLSVASAYLRWGPTRPISRFTICAVACLGLFYVAGLWAGALFLVLSLFHEASRRKQGFWGASGAVVVLAAGLLASPFMDLNTARMFNPWVPGSELLFAAAVFLAVPVVAVVLALVPIQPTPPTMAAKGARSKRTAATASGHWFEPTGWQRAGQLALLASGALAVWLAFDGRRQALAEIDYDSDLKDYNRVLATARHLKAMNYPTLIYVQRALYHTGRLGEDLFSFACPFGSEPLSGVAGGLDSCRAQTSTLVEMGLVSDAEHLAHEALEMEGNRPDLLRELARINVLKERPKAARIFLNVLRQMPFQRTSADALLGELERDPQLATDPELARIRSLMVTTDLAHEGLPAEALMSHLLAFNPRNQMAFEYLMIHHLMTLELKPVVDRLPQLDRFTYSRIPRHFEEAVLLYQQLEHTSVALNGRQIRPETYERFNRFNEALKQGLHTTPVGQQILARDFGDTYWYYYYSTQTYLKNLEAKQADAGKP